MYLSFVSFTQYISIISLCRIKLFVVIIEKSVFSVKYDCWIFVIKVQTKSIKKVFFSKFGKLRSFLSVFIKLPPLDLMQRQLHSDQNLSLYFSIICFIVCIIFMNLKFCIPFVFFCQSILHMTYFSFMFYLHISSHSYKYLSFQYHAKVNSYVSL